MDLNTYKLFNIVAEHENISYAANLTKYTQSSVSHTMKRLEEELGLKLFTRDRYGVHLTAVGHELIPKVRELLTTHDQLEQIINDIKGIEFGTINIGTFSSIAIHWLPNILEAYHKEHPQIQILIKEGGIEELYSWVTNRDVDFSFYNYSPSHNIDFIPIQKDDYVAIFPKDYPLDMTLESYPISNFNGKPFILFDPSIEENIQKLLEEQNVSPCILCSSREDFTIMSMVEHHLGFSILPRLIVEQRKEHLQILPLAPSYQRILGIGIKSYKNASPATKTFIDFVMHYFNKNISFQ
ncbi:LysR family transcriptional regulator [Anaerotignum sp.]|uniref:LysR family transcriptional regulator n=1 Tax=Anaerotignum sp. TaxID=2039241 RepID=UPI00289E42F3|nr:LysR family transcriptional regulator [Anaerotignum sp.]